MTRYLLVLLSILLFSRKSKQLLEPPPVIVYKDIQHIEDEEKSIENKSYLYCKITDIQGNPLVLVASQLVVAEESCYSAYSDFDGFLQLRYDKTKITPNSYLEIVYKGFSKKVIPFANLEKEKGKEIQLETGDSVVTKEMCKCYYTQIRNCRYYIFTCSLKTKIQN
ncbi:hypothetical protein [Kordia sp.]|uniref:hypothetical protein n=1 Tax=Kordia sp. TaxID=1965332 RepID=UPI003D27E625